MIGDDKINDTLAAASAAVTGPSTPNSIKVDRPTSKAEWTLIGAGVACVALALFFGSILAFHDWTGQIAKLPIDKLQVLVAIVIKIVWFLGVVLLIMGGGVLLMIVALISPSVGHVSARAGPGGIEGSIDGKPGDQT